MSRKSDSLCSVVRAESSSNARIQTQFECPSHLNALLSASRGLSQSLKPEVKPDAPEVLHACARSVPVVQSDHFRAGTSVI